MRSQKLNIYIIYIICYVMLIKNKLLIILNYYNNIYNIINYNIIYNKLLIYLKNSQIDITIENGDIIKYITTKANIIKKYNNKIEYIENRKQHRRIYIKPFISNRILKSETKKTVVKDYYKDYIWLFFRYKKKDELACYKKRIKIEYINNEIHNTITNYIIFDNDEPYDIKRRPMFLFNFKYKCILFA